LVERTFTIGNEPVTGTITLRGDLDLSAVKAFEQALRASVDHGGPITLDATELAFMDSTGVRLLIHTAQRLEGRGCLIVHGANEAVRRVIELTGIDDRIENLHVIAHEPHIREATDG
jgi:anti-sigma B factor antagonist